MQKRIWVHISMKSEARCWSGQSVEEKLVRASFAKGRHAALLRLRGVLKYLGKHIRIGYSPSAQQRIMKNFAPQKFFSGLMGNVTIPLQCVLLE